MHVLMHVYFLILIGMSKECLEATFDLIKVKARRVNAWKGNKKTNRVQIHSKYLKVRITYLTSWQNIL